jgi:4-hydroxybenzoate polyprenyltransferase
MLTLMLPSRCGLALATYAAVSLTYSFQVKRVPVLDVLCLGVLFTARIAVGASLLENSTPYWLYAFSMFFFTSLAFVKRYTELAQSAGKQLGTLPGRGYQAEDQPLVLGAGLGSALCSIVVFLIYLGDQHFDRDLFSTPGWLGLSVAILAYWLLRTWLLALRGQMHDDPGIGRVQHPHQRRSQRAPGMPEPEARGVRHGGGQRQHAQRRPAHPGHVDGE